MSTSNSTVATHPFTTPGEAGLDRNGRTGLALALVSAASFSTAGSFARSLTDAGWSPGAAVAARVSVAAVMLALPAALAMRGRWHVLRRNAGMIALYGLLAVAGGQVFYFHAIEHLSVGVALLIEYLGTVLVVGWMWLRHGHRPRRLTAIGSLIAVLGLVFVIDVFGETRVDAVGVAWALAGAVGLAVYFVMSARTDDELPPIAFASAGMTAGAIILFGLGGIGALPLRATFGTVEFAGGRASWLVPVIGVSLLGAAVAYVAGIGAARRLGAQLAAFIGLTEVVFAVLVAWALLGQLPTSVQLLGGALIVAGVALVRADEIRTRSAPPR
jgi:drug/metabolite transporter (DMT)-like permease